MVVPPQMTSRSDSAAIPAESRRAILLATAVVALVSSVVSMYLIARYAGVALTDQLLFSTADHPPTSDPISDYVVGAAGHVFGDFAVTYENVTRSPFDPYVSPVAYGTPYGMPFLLLLKGLFAIGSYKFQLAFFMTASVVAMAVPAVWASMKLRWPERIWVVALFGAVPFPVLMALDRGNPQSLVVPVLFLGALWIERKQWLRAGIAIVVGTCLKFYPLLLVIPLFLQRKFRVGLLALGVSIVAITLTLVAIDGGLGTGISEMLDVTRHHSGRNAAGDFGNFEFFNWSTAGGLAQVAGLLHLSIIDQGIARFPQLPGLVVLGVCVLALALAWDRFPSWARATLYLAPTQLAIPIAYPYTMVWVLVPIAFAIRNPVTNADVELNTTTCIPRWLQVCGLVILAGVASIKPTWSALSSLLIPDTAGWVNTAQVIDSLGLTALVLALAAYGVRAALTQRRVRLQR